MIAPESLNIESTEALKYLNGLKKEGDLDKCLLVIVSLEGIPLPTLENFHIDYSISSKNIQQLITSCINLCVLIIRQLLIEKINKLTI